MKKMWFAFFVLVMILVLSTAAFAAVVPDDTADPCYSSVTYDLSGIVLGSGSSTSQSAGTCAVGSSVSTNVKLTSDSVSTNFKISISGAASSSKDFSGRDVSWTYNVTTAGSYTTTIKNTGSGSMKFASGANVYVFKM